MALRSTHPMDYDSSRAFHSNSDAVLTKFDLALQSAESLLRQVRNERKESHYLPTYYQVTSYYNNGRSRRLLEQAENRKTQQAEEARLQEEFLKSRRELREHQAMQRQEAEQQRQAKIEEIITYFEKDRKEKEIAREQKRERMREQDKQAKEELKKEKEKMERIAKIEAYIQKLKIENEKREQENKLIEEKKERDLKEKERRKLAGIDYTDYLYLYNNENNSHNNPQSSTTYTYNSLRTLSSKHSTAPLMKPPTSTSTGTVEHSDALTTLNRQRRRSRKSLIKTGSGTGSGSGIEGLQGIGTDEKK